MNVQIFLRFVIVMGLVVNIEANCCKRKGPLCCGNGKCDMRCCNCTGGCNANCEPSNFGYCGPSVRKKCNFLLGFCFGACVPDPDNPVCVACLGAEWLECHGCYRPPPVNKQRAFDDTKNIPYNVLLEHLMEIAEEKNKKSGH